MGVEWVIIEMHLQPDEHAAHGPLEGVHCRFANETPLSVRIPSATRRCGFDKLSPLIKNLAHTLHPPLIVPTQPLEPPDPPISLPSLIFLTSTAPITRLRANDQLCNHRLDEARGLLRATFRNPQETLAESRLGGDPS